jgi:hypothetical protein
MTPQCRDGPMFGESPPLEGGLKASIDVPDDNDVPAPARLCFQGSLLSHSSTGENM